MLSRRHFLGHGALAVTALPLVLSAAGCAQTPPPEPVITGELRWTNLAPIRLAAVGPQISTTYQAPRRDPYVDHMMPFAPEQAIKAWVQDRLSCTGVGDQTVRVVIEDASVVEVPLTPKGGVGGFFTDEPETRYEARATVAVQLLAADGSPLVQIRQTAWRTKSINEKSSVADRERAWFQLVESLMMDLNGALDGAIRSNFGDALLR